MPLKNISHIFLWPMVMAVLTLLGLVIALLDDGVLEKMALVGLVLPIAVVLYFYSKSFDSKYFYFGKPKRDRL